MDDRKDEKTDVYNTCAVADRDAEESVFLFIVFVGVYEQQDYLNGNR